MEDLIFIDEVNPLRMQTHKMGAVFTVFSPHTGIDAEQIGIRAVGAFTQRDA